MNDLPPAGLPRRRSIRLGGFDYTQNSSFFITLCAANRAALFGRVVNGTVHLSPLGMILEEEWRKTAATRRYVDLDAYVVMPNHFHALFTFLRDESPCRGVARYARQPGPLRGPAGESVGAVVRGFKSAVTRRARRELSLSGAIWQRNYFERIIRNAREFGGAQEYVSRNPENWEIDHDNPDAVHEGRCERETTDGA